MRVPLFFSETRLPNHAARVLDSFLKMIYPLVRRLHGVQEENIQGTGDQKSKAMKATDLMNKIYNVKFILSLPALVDI